MTKGVRAFVDTNVLLRAIHSAMPLHFEADQLIAQTREQGYELWISRQIIREYIAQVTRPTVLATPLGAEAISAKIQVMRTTFKIADETDEVTERLLELIKKYPSGGKQIHDANIVATMLVYQVDTLLTQNVEDLKRFSPEIRIVPLNTQF